MKKSEKTKLTISKIIEAAINEFGKNGYVKGTINNICKTGINKGLLYHNFSGKDELYLACLNLSCNKLVQCIQKQDREKNFEAYLITCMDIFTFYSNEAHIFFEALFTPPIHLVEKINPIISEFAVLNKQIISQKLKVVPLRNDIVWDDSISYFHMMITMLNYYFSTSSFYNAPLEWKIYLREKTLPQILNFILYGVAKKEG